MKRPIQVRAFGGPGAIEELARRLCTPLLHGWRRETYGAPLVSSPSGWTFESPAERLDRRVLVHLCRHRDLGEIEVEGVEVPGLHDSRPEHAALRDPAVLAFQDDVLAPLAQETGAAVCATSPEVSIDDLVPRRVANALWAFVGTEIRGEEIHPQDAKRFHTIVALVHTTRAPLDGHTLWQWLREDLGWPRPILERFSRELDHGLAVLRAYEWVQAQAQDGTPHSPCEEGP